MAVLLAIPILSSLLVIQTALVNRFPLLHGVTDLVLIFVIAWALQERVQTAWQWGIIGGLLVSIVSGLPIVVPWITYPAAVGLALFLRHRLWKVPILAMFVATLFCTLLSHALTMIVLRLTGRSIPLLASLNEITLPSLLLNLLLAIPAYALMSELAGRLYPEELEV